MGKRLVFLRSDDCEGKHNLLNDFPTYVVEYGVELLLSAQVGKDLHNADSKIVVGVVDGCLLVSSDNDKRIKEEGN